MYKEISNIDFQTAAAAGKAARKAAEAFGSNAGSDVSETLS